jgi:tetratricopeptide (TPR) repeat protein
MRNILLATLILGSIFAGSARCQIHRGNTESINAKADKALRAAAAYEDKLSDSSVTLDQVIANWRATAENPDVRADTNSYAISIASVGMFELQKGNTHLGDSLLGKAMPLFRKRLAMAPFLVQYAELERSLHKNSVAMRAYDQIVNTMDSIGQLWDIQFYRLSGYAPYAYAIDASFGMEQIALHDSTYRKKAIELLTKTMKRHPVDALGMMTIVALHRLGAMSDETYKFQVDLLCSRKPALRKVCNTFESRFSEMK